jgi:hypothetical protein
MTVLRPLLGFIKFDRQRVTDAREILQCGISGSHGDEYETESSGMY